MSDADLHKALVRGHSNGELQILVSRRTVARWNRMGYVTEDIAAPPYMIVLLSLLDFVSFGLASSLLYLFIDRRRAEERTRVAGLASLVDWEALWQMGGITIQHMHNPNLKCRAPLGDWREFVRGYVAISSDSSNISVVI